MAEPHEGFIRGSEAYLAGVWYVMKDAEARWRKDQARIEKGRLNPWAFLRMVQKAMGYEARRVPYSIMRQELIEFAETFGVDGKHPAAPISTTNRQAQEEFK
jgi:hypothetical protein